MDKMYCKRVVAIAVALSSYLWSGWPDPHLSYLVIGILHQRLFIELVLRLGIGGGGG